MPAKIQTTTMLGAPESGAPRKVEIQIAESSDIDASSESVCLRVDVSVDEPFLPSIQEAALKRAMEICREQLTALRKQWPNDL